MATRPEAPHFPDNLDDDLKDFLRSKSNLRKLI